MKQIGVLSLLLYCHVCFGLSDSDYRRSFVKPQITKDASNNPENNTEDEADCLNKCFLSSADAIKSTLQNQWTIQTSEQETVVQVGLLQQATGAFDTQLNGNLSKLYQVDLQSPLGLIKSDFVGQVTTTNVLIQKLSRIGTLYSFGYDNVNTVNPFTIILEPPRSDSTVVSFSINQPLLRNLFYSPQTTLEKTQFLVYEASVYQNVQNIADAVAATLTAYWQLVGNKKILKALIKQEEEFTNYVEYAQKLVEEEQQGSASLYQPLANLANATVNRLQGEQNVRNAYNALMFAMGRAPPREDENTYLCLNLEDFPPLEHLNEFGECCFQNYLSLIPDQRKDIVAAFLLEDVAALNLQSAVNSLLPELNVVGRAALLNTNSGRNDSALYQSFPFNRPEKDFFIGLSLSYPLCNNVAKGLVKQTRALLFQAQINTSQLESQIITNFKIAFTLHNSLVEQLKEARKASKDFRAAADAEFLKLQHGLSSWFDVLGLATDALGAEIQEYDIEILYVQNLIQLHLLVGDLVNWDGHTECMDIADFKQFLCFNDQN
jgi:outer membrane protein TolC